MAQFMKAIGCGCAMLLAAGCGGGNSHRFSVPPTQMGRDLLLERFSLMDIHHRPSVPRDPATGGAPFGALVQMPRFGQGRLCSVSHAGNGVVVTNAHCIDQAYVDVTEYFVVFYDAHSIKHVEGVVRVGYRGEKSYNDIAILHIDPAGARDWDVLGQRLLPTQSEVDARPPVAHQVTVWSFDPYHSYAGQIGMVFSPKRCIASRTRPELQVNHADSQHRGRDRDMGVQIDSRIHFFMDNCSDDVIQGNSGSMVTAAESSAEGLLGVVHWVYGIQNMEPRQSFEYRGNDGVPRALRPQSYWQDFIQHVYSVGTSLEALDREVLTAIFR